VRKKFRSAGGGGSVAELCVNCPPRRSGVCGNLCKRPFLIFLAHALGMPEQNDPGQPASHESAWSSAPEQFNSEDLGNAHGLLEAGGRTMGSILQRAADATKLPAGAALDCSFEPLHKYFQQSPGEA